jgi:DNA-binding MarR family transcriptional regulator
VATVSRPTLSAGVPVAITHHVRDTCMCLHLQRAARVIGRRFDNALREAGLSNWQFSLLMALNQPAPPPMGAVARLLGMDRTTLTAAVKPLQRRGLVEVRRDACDRRSRRLSLTAAGQATLAAAVPIWRETHRSIEQALPHPDRLRAALREVAALAEPYA